MVLAACFVNKGRDNMSLICPFCTREITLDATECPWCGTSYGSDTRKFIRKAIGDLEEEDRRSQVTPRNVRRSFKIAYPTARTLERSYLSEPESGGLYIRTNDPPEKGERFRLKIRLPNGEKDVEVWCEVIWAQRGGNGTMSDSPRPGMGVKFLDLSQESKKAIMAILGQGGR